MRMLEHTLVAECNIERLSENISNYSWDCCLETVDGYQ